LWKFFAAYFIDKDEICSNDFASSPDFFCLVITNQVLGIFNEIARRCWKFLYIATPMSPGGIVTMKYVRKIVFRVEILEHFATGNYDELDALRTVWEEVGSSVVVFYKGGGNMCFHYNFQVRSKG
jgi:hypothetical protein